MKIMVILIIIIKEGVVMKLLRKVKTCTMKGEGVRTIISGQAIERGRGMSPVE